MNVLCIPHLFTALICFGLLSVAIAENHRPGHVYTTELCWLTLLDLESPPKWLLAES